LFLTLRKLIPHRRDQWSTLPKFVSRAAENLRLPFFANEGTCFRTSGLRNLEGL
jgi:hypothetical protein